MRPRSHRILVVGLLALGLVAGTGLPVVAVPTAVPVARPLGDGPTMSAGQHGGGSVARTSRKLYVDPDSQAASAAAAARRDGRRTTAKRLNVIASAPQARWFGTWNSTRTVKADVRAYVKAAQKKKRVPQLVLYAIPNRDCGGWSSGGFTATEYRAWIRKVAAGLKGSRAVVVLEPDSLGHTCGGSQRTALLKDATKRLTKSGAWVYLDGGHSRWNSPTAAAKRLKAAGVSAARGFAVNVSNFNSTKAEVAYGKKVAAQLAKRGVSSSHRRFVVDTSRNGRATAKGAWCNPARQGLGRRPRWVSKGGVDAYLWVKRPGESDGSCGGGPAAGQWFESYALGLVARRVK
ncbi:glycoside hydrolase family 6 protein [Sanguibacter sp. A247]|uniref:glycoside hydrolase family 6 protein n=1 Tax=unclassified Sanguibacter TaxID=2645534 RepID=UPI003FD6D43A